MSDFVVSAWLNGTWAAEDVVAVAKDVEAAGYDGIWLADHFMANTGTAERSDTPLFECFGLLAGLATVVPRVRLGSLVASMTYRHPAVLANTAATIDELSGGRLVLGMGAGWQLNEHAAYGIELGSVTERIDRLEEGLAVLTGMLRTERTTVEGTHYTVTDAPRVPTSGRRIPIMLGAAGERRMLGVVARRADEWNCWSTPELFARKSAVLDEHCARIGRDPRTIRRSTQAILDIDGTPTESRQPIIAGSVNQIVDVIGRWREAGLDELIVPGIRSDAADARVLFERFHAEIRPQLG
ncbi:TIGR03560 family F420-dependent LLM class oxidoreductase [Pseudonocardia sp. GCM10023141]|uniref:TIGR03560 family F420-dependent LLM class oxidoreductase n=1 Tax=Pseudonocardia sp. GCM10023141 TaxID=3252653 RepID=UPI003616C985